MNIFRTILIFSLSILCTSCISTHLQRRAFYEAYQEGNFAAAESILSTRISTEMPEEAYWKGKDVVCLLLDRATTRFAEGKVHAAITDFDLAIQAIDYYQQACTLETSGQVLLEDDCAAYSGSHVERLLARIYFALALCHQGDLKNATALLRQAEDIQQCHIENREFNSQNPLAKYLLALLSEHQGDVSNAELLYKETKELLGSTPPEIDISQNYQKNAQILFVCHNGTCPFKITATTDASIVSAAALELILAENGAKPALSSLTGIPIPMLCQNPFAEPSPTFVSVENCSSSLNTVFNVATAEYKELNQKLPLIATRAAARMIIRRGAVAYSQQQDPCLGALVDIGMLIANLQTKADTRSWTTLPSTIDLSRFKLFPGQHKIKIHIKHPGCIPYEKSFCLLLKEDDLCVINIFNINQQVSTILIPPRFNIKGDPL